jgi:hypothetical protein
MSSEKQKIITEHPILQRMKGLGGHRFDPCIDLELSTYLNVRFTRIYYILIIY